MSGHGRTQLHRDTGLGEMDSHQGFLESAFSCSSLLSKSGVGCVLGAFLRQHASGAPPDQIDPPSIRVVAFSAQEPSVSYDGLTFGKHMLAGATAGMVEHLTMFPVDTVKTRMQALSHPGQQLNSRSVKRALKVILKREGVGGLYNGVTAVALGAGPSHAIYFASYELAKEMLGGNGAGHHPIETAVAGAAATAASDLVMTPWDVIKQRLQVEGTPYKGVVDCAVQTWRTRGITGFYKSYRTTLLMNIPFVAIHFPIYESTKKFLNRDEEDEGLLVQLTAGGVAGASSGLLTNPMDVVKTRLQTEGVNSKIKYSSSEIQTMRMIIAKEGSRALWSGAQARMLFHTPAAAVSWCTYETAKSFMSS